MHIIGDTGFQYESDSYVDKIPDFDPRSANHFWTMFVAYKVDPKTWVADEKIHFDMENLVSVMGPGCFYCEQVYTPLLDRRRCPGKPK